MSHDVQTESGLFQIDFLIESLSCANLQRRLRRLKSGLLDFEVVAARVKI